MENNKKKKIVTIVMALVALISVIGASYAVWRYTFTGSANTIETSKIELELLESTDEVIRVENALPMSDEEGKSQNKTFNFAVTTRTKAVQDIGYSLKLEKLTVDSGYTSLNDNQIKVYLTDYNNNQLLSQTLVSNLSNYVLYSKTNSHNGSIEEIQDKYKLRVWIDKDVLVNDWNENTKLQYKFKIGIREKQEQISSTYAVYSFSEDYVYLGDALDLISGYTTDYNSLNQSFFLKHNIGSDNTVKSNEVCYLLNGNQYCIKGCSKYNEDEGKCETTNLEENSAILLESFGEDNCSIGSGYVKCSSSGIYALANLHGVSTYDDDFHCGVDSFGDADCYREYHGDDGE